MGKIFIENMEFYAYHGCFHEEQIIGNKFIVNIELDYDTRKAEISDKLEDTINYQKVYKIIEEEMNIKSYLIEHIAHRIIERIYSNFNNISHIKIKLSKLHPPVGGKVSNVSIEIER